MRGHLLRRLLWAEALREICMPEIHDIRGVGPVLASAFAESGYGSVKQVATSSVAELAAVPGVGQARARALISAAQLLLNGADVSAATDAVEAGPSVLATGAAKGKSGKSGGKKDKKGKKPKKEKKDKNKNKNKKKRRKDKNKKKKKK
jgi:NAD-dependent DNA ligase